MTHQLKLLGLHTIHSFPIRILYSLEDNRTVIRNFDFTLFNIHTAVVVVEGDIYQITADVSNRLPVPWKILDFRTALIFTQYY